MTGFRGARLRYALAFAGAVAWILQGYDQGVLNGLLTLPTFTKQFPSIDTSTAKLKSKNSTLQGTAVALYEVGAAFGALACYFLGDRLGRKWTTFLGAAVVLVGVILQTTSYQLAQLIVARIVTGLGVGSFTANIPTWVGESLEHQRGSLVMIEGSGAVLGVTFVGWLELGFYFTRQNEVAWRFPVAFQAIFPIIVMIMVPMLEESPRWLVAKDRRQEAAVVISKLEDQPQDSQIVTDRLQIIRGAIEQDGQGHSSNPFARTPNRHLNRTLIAIAVNILAQMSGINVISFYSNIIFQHDLGYSPVLSRVITGCLETWQFLMATAAVFMVDRFGRRKLLITSAFLMCVANAGLAGLQSHGSNNKIALGCSLIFYFLALAAFPVGLLLIPFMYSSEIAPLRIRSKVTAMSGFSNWMFNFLVAELTPAAFEMIGWKYYLVYVGTNLLSVVTFYLFLPETKNRTLEDIDAFFVGSKNALQPVRVAKTMPEGAAGKVKEGWGGAEDDVLL